MNQQLTQEQLDLLTEIIYGSYTIKDNKINVKGDVFCLGQNFATLPFQFDIVLGDFDVTNVGLTSLIGCPRIIDGSFLCDNNNITNLEYFPQVVRGAVHLERNSHLQLSDKLFNDLAKIGRNKIQHLDSVFQQLKEQIPTQFGVTNRDIINEIWDSYLGIFNGF